MAFIESSHLTGTSTFSASNSSRVGIGDIVTTAVPATAQAFMPHSISQSQIEASRAQLRAPAPIVGNRSLPALWAVHRQGRPFEPTRKHPPSPCCSPPPPQAACVRVHPMVQSPPRLLPLPLPEADSPPNRTSASAGLRPASLPEPPGSRTHSPPTIPLPAFAATLSSIPSTPSSSHAPHRAPNPTSRPPYSCCPPPSSASPTPGDQAADPNLSGTTHRPPPSSSRTNRRAPGSTRRQAPPPREHVPPTLTAALLRDAAVPAARGSG
jgi:hypothetical protein